MILTSWKLKWESESKIRKTLRKTNKVYSRNEIVTGNFAFGNLEEEGFIA